MIDGKKIVATIEARMTSTRLPGKVLMPLVGEPALARLIERLRRSTYIDDVVVATTTNAPDDAIVALCEKLDCHYHRGSEDDVLLRVLEAAKKYDADIIVEICGDQPLIDHRHIDEALGMFFKGEYAYVGNHLPQTFPLGFEVKIFPTAVLDEVNRISQDPYDHEHVSLYIYNHPEKYKVGNIAAQDTMKRPDLRFTLDTQEDYELISAVYERLLPINSDFSAQDVVELLTNEPHLAKINESIRQRDPYHKGFLER